MTAAETGLPVDRALTVDDLEPLLYDGNRYELDDGVLIVTPPPIVGHQKPFACDIVPSALVAGPWQV